MGEDIAGPFTEALGHKLSPKEILATTKAELSESKKKFDPFVFDRAGKVQPLPKPMEMEDKINQLIEVVNKHETTIREQTRTIEILDSFARNLLEIDGIKTLIGISSDESREDKK